MAFRILPNGAIETDTIEEFRKLQSQRPMQKPRSQQGDRNKPPTAKGAELIQSNKLFLGALLKSSSGLNTDELTRIIGIEPKSLPPVLRSLRKWCQRKKLEFDGLIEKHPAYINKRYVTVYSLTDHGRVTFAGMVSVTMMNGKDAAVNTS